MIVYHGTTMIIKRPQVKYAKDYLDFGRGFYVTTYREQAEKWAKRKSIRQNRDAVVNICELNEKIEGLKILTFENENERWLDFVCACRRGEKLYESYDIIIGNVANDDVFKTVDMYFRGVWDKNRTIKELRYYKMNDQICIVNQEILDKVLRFKESYEVK